MRFPTRCCLEASQSSAMKRDFAGRAAHGIVADVSQMPDELQ
jgi:hypothetical protein